SIGDIALLGMMIAVMEVCKRALDFLPNVELITFWTIMFTLLLGRKAVLGALVFAMIEGMLFGFHMWWISYLYIWPILVWITWLFRKNTSVVLWAVIAGIYGLAFGAGCALPYFVVGAAGGGIRSGLYTAFTWWIAGIPFDLIHGVSNFTIMLILYTPVRQVIDKLSPHRRPYPTSAGKK
ncbi:MAG: hypothetical protein HDR26_08305, partial [Lachnospiraceae bacterium]|nr:hypothetical protein [Lachnospiraceae bacterium]